LAQSLSAFAYTSIRHFALILLKAKRLVNINKKHEEATENYKIHQRFSPNHALSSYATFNQIQTAATFPLMPTSEILTISVAT
jgi:hypothetical protein